MLAAALVVCRTAVAVADDAWDLATLPDDDSTGPNTLIHGSAQTHDLQNGGAPGEQDWFQVRVRARQSYEVRAYGATVFFSVAGGPICAAGFCASLARVDSLGGILQGAALVEGDAHTPAVRFTAAADGSQWFRVRGPDVANTNDQYSITFLNTTLFAPRFNNSASQTTVLVLQNTTSAVSAGSVDFWNTAGTLLHGEPFSIAAHGVLVLNSSTLAGLAGQSGSVSVSHDAGYGGLAGKAVAVEPATGFTFDTALTPVPR
jgi:hypothetical protein